MVMEWLNKPDFSAYRFDATWPISALKIGVGGGWRTFNVLVFFFFPPKWKIHLDHLEKCLAVFTIISRNDSTKLLFLQLFIDLSVAVGGGGPRPCSVARTRGCSYQAEAEGVSGPAEPLPRSLGPAGHAPPRPRGPRLPRQQPAPPLRLGRHFRLLSGHSGLGFPAAAGSWR